MYAKVPIMIAMSILVSSLVLPHASAATSCSVSDQSKNCTFACVEGDKITVSASSNSAVFQATVSGSCGGQTTSCQAEPRGSCTSPASGTTNADQGGQCKFSGTSGTGSCTASGGTGGG